MTISIECVHCHKRYNAPGAMAGKKVKCKHCGQIFAIPANAPQAGDSDLSSVGEKLSEPAPSKSRTPTGGGKLGNPSAGFSTKVARSESAQTLDFADLSGGGVMLRPSIPMDFAGADALDRLAPLFLILVGYGWLALSAFNSNKTGFGWVGLVRFIAFMALSAGVAFPLGYWAVRSAARKHRFMLPPTPGLRGLAAFALSFTLPIAFWQLSGSTTMLIFGACMGLVLACAGVWFLFRVQGEEMTPVLGGTAGAFVASVLIAYFALFGIDSLFRAAAQRSGTNQLTSSPMGTIDWDVPIGTGPEVKPKHHPVAVTPPDTGPETQPATQGGPTSKPANSNIIVDVTKPPDNGTSVMPKPATMATTTDTTTPPATTTTTIASAIPVRPAPTVVKPAVVDVTEPASPLVAKISVIADLEDGSQVVFSPGPGTVAAAIKVGATEETVTFFAGNPMVKKGEAKFEVENGTSQHYCLSANGDTLARVITFPKLAVQLWNTFTNKETRVVPLDSTRGTPELLGFGANESLVVLWNKRNQPDIEVVNSKSTAGQTVAFLRLKAFDQSPCNPMISMDGRQLAVAAFLNEKGGIDLWDLQATRKSELRTCWVPLTTWAPPTGIAYGQVGGMLAAFFEVNGKGILYSFRTGDGAMQHEHPYRTLPYPAGAAGDYSGRTLEFLDANTWLLLGRSLIDVDSGKVLGDVQIETPKAQRVMDKETVLLHTVNAEGKHQLLQVKLKADAIVAKRNEARGIRPAAKAP